MRGILIADPVSEYFIEWNWSNRALVGLVCAVMLWMSATKPAQADLVISSPGTTTSIDFESSLSGSNNGTYSGAGFDPGASMAGRLDSNSWKITGLSDGDLQFGDTGITGDFARGTDGNGTSTGGVYAFDASSDGGSIGFGLQPTGNDFNPGALTLRLRNETGAVVNSFDIGYQVRIRNDQNRASSLKFSYSLDDANYIPVSFFDVISDQAASSTPSWELKFDGTTTISGLSLADGARLYFRWTGDDVSGSGARDEFHLDNIDMVFHAATVPEPAPVTGLIVCLLCVSVWTLSPRTPMEEQPRKIFEKV